jgi:VWFA-related protein
MNEPSRFLALLGMAGALATPQQVPTFRSQVDLVTVDAVALDSTGRPVPDLTKDDFVVTEDGRPVAIESFEAFTTELPDQEKAPTAIATNESAPGKTGSGRAFAILVDDLWIAPEHADVARNAVAAFLEKSVRDGDEVTLATSSGRLWWSARVPEGTEDLLAVLGRVRGQNAEPPSYDRMTEYEAFVITNYEDSPSMSGAPGGGGGGSVSGRAPSTSGDARIAGIGSGATKERVKARWQTALLCTPTNCDQMVRGRAHEIDSRRRSRVTATLQTARRELFALTLVHGRKSLLILSDGIIQDRGSELREIASASREANTAIYFLDVRGLIAQPGFGSAAEPVQFQLPDVRDQVAMTMEETTLAAAGAETLADETGGFSVRNTNDLAAGAERIAKESRVFYLLGFYPPEGKSPHEWRKLKVEVRKPGLTVRARRGYTLRVAGNEPPKVDKKEKEKAKPGPDPVVARALDSAHDAAGIPLRAVAYILEPRAADKIHVVVAAEFDARRLAAPAVGHPRLDISVVAVNRDSDRGFRHDDVLDVPPDATSTLGWRAFAREFELPAGITQARVVVRDPVTGALGAVSQRFEVPTQGILRLSTPILTEHLEPAHGAGGRPQPALAVHRVFRPEGGLYVQFEVFGASRSQGAPRIFAGVEVLTGGGRSVRKLDPTPITADADGRVVRLTGIPLDGLGEGPHQLILDVTDQATGAHLKQHESFTLSRE